jgi:diguanylate cyclase (GGDEF)-like protein
MYMDSGAIRVYRYFFSLLLVAAAIAYLAVELRASDGALLENLPHLAALAAAAMCASYLSSLRAEGPSPRLALSFVVAAFLVLPPPGGLLVVLLSGLAGRGAGVAGTYAGGTIPLSALAAAGAATVFIRQRMASMGSADSLAGLAQSGFCFLLVQALAFALSLLLSFDRPRRKRGWRLALWRSLALEALCVPLAWVLASLLMHGRWLHTAVISIIILAGEVTLLRHSRTVWALRESKRLLASRISELDTLHSIGREVLSSVEPRRVFSIIERECRKILEVDYCFISLAESDSSRLTAVYRHKRGDAATTDELELGEGIATAAAQEKRAMRIDDFESCPEDSPLRTSLVAENSRSALVVPLIVDERVIGVLSVQSTKPGAYDDHQLSVLTTIAQQAAVAIENARHYQKATVDSLTGFFLRDHFFKRLDEEHKRVSRYGGGFSLLMLDLDGFKEINDKSGHLAGDHYLRSISSTIGKELRSADIACRYGGDEFCILLPETDIAGATAIAERIRAAVAGHVAAVDGLALRATTSIGVAAFPGHGAKDASDVMRCADEALYRAKRAGRDCVVPFAA